MTTEESKIEIAKWGRREIELVHQKQALEADLASAMLDKEPGTGGADHERVERMLIETRAMDKAITAAQERRKEAVTAKRQAEIQAVKDRMEELRKEASVLTAKVEEHKQVLSHILGTPIDIVCAIPRQRSRLQQLTIMLMGMTEQITSLEMSPVRSSGTIDLMDSTATVDEVALAVLSTHSTCPSAEAVLAWFAGFGDRVGQRRVYLVWLDGQIDLKASYVKSLVAACR